MQAGPVRLRVRSRSSRRGAGAAAVAILASGLTIAAGGIPAAATSSLAIVGSPITWVETSGGALHVIGEVENAGPDPAQFVRVACTLYDAANTALKTDTVTTSANILLKDDRSPFDDLFQTPPAFDHAGCALTGGSSTLHVADHNFTTTISGVSTDASGVQHVSGTVVNNNQVTDDDVKTMVTFRDSTGVLVDADAVYINHREAVLAGPNNAASFVIDRYPDQPAWDGIVSHASVLTEAASPAAVVPATMVFGDQVQGTTSPPTTLTVGNNGTGDLHVSSVALGAGSGFAIVADGCSGATLQPDASCRIGLTFTPATVGTNTATLTLNDDANGTPHTVSLLGSGLSRAQLAASPSTIDFGNRLVQSRTNKNVTVSSGGPGDLDLGQISFAPTNNDLSIDPSGCPALIVAGSSCTIVVTYQPSTDRASAVTLTINGQDADGNPARNSPAIVTITGNGTQAHLAVAPTSLDFGSANLSSVSGVMPVTLTNDGTGPMTFSSFTFSGDAKSDYAETDDCGQGLDVEQSCTVNVTFTPTAAGTRAAQLVITDSGVNNGTVDLTGDGVLPKGGYWLVARDGGIFTFGDAGYFGSTGNMVLNQPILGMALTPDRNGYWLVARDGGIFTFGDAPFRGSTGGWTLNKPVVGMASPPGGNGYWLVASDGGIFTFGVADFFGSTGGLRLNKPIVGMAPTPDGAGYYLVASDGGIFTFGDAVFVGSTGALALNQPIVGMALTPSGRGYWLVARDGGIFTFGDAGFFGSTGSLRLNQPIVGMAPTADGAGYYLVASDGGIFAFGDAVFRGSTGGIALNQPIVAMAAD